MKTFLTILLVSISVLAEQVKITPSTNTDDRLIRNMFPYMDGKDVSATGTVFYGAAPYTQLTQPYLTNNLLDSNFLRTNFWLYSIPGWNALSRSRSTDAGVTYSRLSSPVTLLSRWHVTCAWHSMDGSPPISKNIMIWRSDTGTWITNIAIGGTNFGYNIAASGHRDVWVGILSNAMPDSVPSMAVAADSFTNGTPYFTGGTYQSLTNLHYVLRKITSYDFSVEGYRINHSPASGSFAPWWPVNNESNFIGGDSGAPGILIINTNLAWIGNTTWGSAITRPQTTAQLQTVMDNLSTEFGKPQQTLRILTP